MARSEFGSRDASEFLIGRLRKDSSPRAMEFPSSDPIIDPETFKFIEGENLFSALNHTSTRVGETTFFGAMYYNDL